MSLSALLRANTRRVSQWMALTVDQIFLDPSTSTRFQARAHFFKQSRCREDEISCKSRPLDNEFAGKSARVRLKPCIRPRTPIEKSLFLILS